MADIQAFSALRYDLGKVGSLSDVVAPPYDVIDAELQDQLYSRHESNVVRLILNRGDDLHDGENIYQRAAHHLKTWVKDGVIRADKVPAIYVYHQTFEFENQTFTRRGFMARTKIEPFGEGQIYPHEETHSKAKEDRFKLMTACQANLSPIFSIFPDADNEVQDILETAISDRTPLTAIDHLGVKHEMWLVTDVNAIAAASAVMGDKPMYIADGHHRYETATNIQAAARESKEAIASNDPVNYVMMMCVSMHDPGMVVLPTHRLFRGIAPITSAEFCEKISDSFDTQIMGNGTALAGEVWTNIEVENEQGHLGFYCRADDTWVLAKLNESGETRMMKIAAEKSESWRGLGVAILHELVIAELLGYTDLPSPSYVHAISEVVDGLIEGDSAGRDATGQAGTGSPFELGCLVMPATLDHVKDISEFGERMPAKSTYFYPKLLSGLLINPIS